MINVLNWMSDIDWGWWPLLSLCPSKDREINNMVVAKVTLLYGPVTGLFLAIFSNHLHSVPMLLSDMGIGSIAFFIVYRVTFAAAWNSRAKKLIQSSEQGILTQG